jgi:hypothetical protein
VSAVKREAFKVEVGAYEIPGGGFMGGQIARADVAR